MPTSKPIPPKRGDDKMSTYSVHPEFEVVIGLEVHVQLSTESKIFSRARARHTTESVADIDVNSQVSPVCAGHPGTLPVLNKKVVDYAIAAGLATHCQIRKKSVFSRKHYFYPDLPKGYQISQYDLPICEHGHLDLTLSDGSQKRVNIQRIHMEEDAGKNVHLDSFSLVNLNRAGVPLIEIVSGADMKTPEEAGAYLRALYAIVTYLGICDGNLQEGNFRCDANVSVMRKGAKEWGTRTETKNVNSFRYVEKAIEYEARRQVDVLMAGGKIIQETRTYDPDQDKTISMRSKEEAHDYRYFPDPDLMPLLLDDAWIERIRSQLPELPDQKKARYVSELGLTAYDAGVLTASQGLTIFFEETLQSPIAKNLDLKKLAKSVSNLLTGEIARLINETQATIESSSIAPEGLARISESLLTDEVSSTGAKTLIAHLWAQSGQPGVQVRQFGSAAVDQMIEQLGLKQVSDLSALEPVIDQVLASNAGQVAQFRAGKDKLIGFFVGQVMKATGGKANPALLQEAILRKLKS